MDQTDFVINYFKNAKNKTFVDIGANDGVSWSNTLRLERDYGWTGICIEPHPTMFERLASNRKAICLELAVNDKEGVLDFMTIEGTWEANMLSGLLENYDPRHRERIEGEYKRYGGTASIKKVKCSPLHDILKKNNIEKVDYLSIDTEGSEENILKSIDFTAVNVELISAEVNYELQPLEAILSSNGYTFLDKVHQDAFFRKLN
jgi:FkbM family methyltransferase